MPTQRAFLALTQTKVVEELEERMLEKMDDILQHVRDSLADGGLDPALEPTAAELRALAMEIDGGADKWDNDGDEEQDDYIEEGAFEGDLDVEED